MGKDYPKQPLGRGNFLYPRTENLRPTILDDITIYFYIGYIYWLSRRRHQLGEEGNIVPLRNVHIHVSNPSKMEFTFKVNETKMGVSVVNPIVRGLNGREEGVDTTNRPFGLHL